MSTCCSDSHKSENRICVMQIFKILTFFCLKMDCYHIPNPQDRAKVISFIERKGGPNPDARLFADRLFAASIKCDKFPSQEVDYYKCPDNCGGLVPLTYSYGYMKNNQDEFLIGECNRCGQDVFHEPNFDDIDVGTRFSMKRNNVVVIFPKKLSHPWSYRAYHCTTVTEHEQVYNDILARSEHQCIPMPEKLESKKWLGKYVTEHWKT